MRERPLDADATPFPVMFASRAGCCVRASPARPGTSSILDIESPSHAAAATQGAQSVAGEGRVRAKERSLSDTKPFAPNTTTQRPIPDYSPLWRSMRPLPPRSALSARRLSWSDA